MSSGEDFHPSNDLISSTPGTSVKQSHNVIKGLQSGNDSVSCAARGPTI